MDQRSSKKIKKDKTGKDNSNKEKKERKGNPPKLEPLIKGDAPRLFSGASAHSRILPRPQDADEKTYAFLKGLHERLAWLMMQKFMEKATEAIEEKNKDGGDKKAKQVDGATMGEFLGRFEIPMGASAFTEEEIMKLKWKSVDLMKNKRKYQKIIELGEKGELTDKRKLFLKFLLKQSQP